MSDGPRDPGDAAQDAGHEPLAASAGDPTALPVAPGLAPAMDAAGVGDAAPVRGPREYEPVGARTVYVAALSLLLAVAAGLAAQLLTRLIGLVTNVAFHGRLATELVAPGAGHREPLVLLLTPVVGALVVGVMARYGSAAIRGHGIPEVMEKVLYGESRIPARVLFLKPLSAAIAIGGGLGAWIGAHAARLAPGVGIDPRIAGLVGMAAIFAGASHALLASVEFAFETTRQPVGLLPLLAGCTAAYLVSLLLGRNSIMTEKLARRGTHVRAEYEVDRLTQVAVRDVAASDVVTLRAADPLGPVRDWLRGGAGGATHQGFPVVDEAGLLIGVVTRRDLFERSFGDDRPVRAIVRRAPVVVYEDSTLRDAADQMVVEHVGRVVVVPRDDERRVVGILTRSDLLAAHAPRLDAAHRAHRARRVWPTGRTSGG